MENNDLCKFQIASDMGYSYKNGFVGGITRTGDTTYIHITIFKVVDMWDFGDEREPIMKNIMYQIATLTYKDNEFKLLIHNDYPEEFCKEIIDGIKKLGTVSCKDCIHSFKRNLLGHDCVEKFTKNKYNEVKSYE